MSGLDEDESVLQYGNPDTITSAEILDTIKDIDTMLEKSIVESSDYYFLKKTLITPRNGLKKKYIVTNNSRKRV